MRTNYQKDYLKAAPFEKEIFNPEREHKIINPHKMESLTQKNDFKSFNAQPKAKAPLKEVLKTGPMGKQTSYKVILNLS